MYLFIYYILRLEGRSIDLHCHCHPLCVCACMWGSNEFIVNHCPVQTLLSDCVYSSSTLQYTLCLTTSQNSQVMMHFWRTFTLSCCCVLTVIKWHFSLRLFRCLHGARRSASAPATSADVQVWDSADHWMLPFRFASVCFFSLSVLYLFVLLLSIFLFMMQAQHKCFFPDGSSFVSYHNMSDRTTKERRGMYLLISVSK